MRPHGGSPDSAKERPTGHSLGRRAAAVLLVALAGCGGDDDKQLSKSEYIDRGDAICVDIRQQIETLGDPKSFEDLVRIAKGTEPLARKGISQLRKLGAPPAEIRDASLALIRELEREVPLLDRLARAARKHDAKAIQALAVTGQADEAKIAAAAKRAGFHACGSAQ